MTYHYSFTFGDFTCTLIKDSGDSLPAEQAFGTVPEDERNQALSNSPYDPSAIELSMNILLLERDGQRILIETGNTANDSQGTNLFPVLEQLGISTESIDIVTVTHAHADHYSGMIDADGHKMFPTADYVMWQDEWDYYSSDEQMARELERGQARHDFIAHYLGGLKPYLRFINQENNQLADDIHAYLAQGHTQYHVRFEVKSQGKTLHIIGDSFIHPLVLNNPHWTFPFDADDNVAIATRRTLRDLVGDDLVLVYHFPFSGLGRIVKNGDSYDWQPV